MIHHRVLSLAVMVFVIAWPAPSPSQGHAGGPLIVQVTGLRNGKGLVQCALYASTEGFPKDKDKADIVTRVPIVGGQAVCTFLNVRYGTYAVSVFHDENNNGKLDVNFLGVPREGVGASNNATGHFGPPKFSDASFAFNDKQTSIAISIHYL